MWCEMRYRLRPSHLVDMEIALAGLEAVAAVAAVAAVIALIVAFYPAVLGRVDDAIGAAVDAVGRVVGRGWASGGEPRGRRRLRRRAASGWAGPPVDRPAHPR